MTKSKLGQTDVKPTELNPAPVYTAVHISDGEHGYTKVSLPGNTCWYVLGVLSTIFCCLPCGVIGMVHAMIAKHEGERGNLPSYNKRMRQAKCWTSWSIALGLLTLIAVILYVIGMTIGFSRAYYAFCGTGSLDNFYWNSWNETVWNSTAVPELIIN